MVCMDGRQRRWRRLLGLQGLAEHVEFDLQIDRRGRRLSGLQGAAEREGRRSAKRGAEEGEGRPARSRTVTGAQEHDFFSQAHRASARLFSRRGRGIGRKEQTGMQHNQWQVGNELCKSCF